MITIRVKRHGNASIEIFGDLHVLVDPNPVVAIEEEADLHAPETTLDKFDLDGEAVEPDDEIKGEIKVLESDCWNSDENVSYFCGSVLHPGDSASFPDPDKKVELVFTACFPDYYDNYIRESKRLEPELVVPSHYNPREGNDDAVGLKQRLDGEGIPSRVLEAGESVEISDW